MRKAFLTQIKDLDSKGRVKVAANALGNVDADEDISEPGSFTKTIAENFDRLRWFLNHDRTLLLGCPLEAKEVFPYLETVGQLNMQKQISRDTYEDYKLYAEYGKSLEHSIGVDAVKQKKEGNIRRVFEWKWWEFSTLTSWGANPNTPMLDIKSAKGIAEAIDWLEIQMRKGNYTDEKFLSIEKQLNTLRSLCSEPEINVSTTYELKPNDIKAALAEFKSLIN